MVITQHEVGGVACWFLYGHLDAASVAFKRVGVAIEKGQKIGGFGAPHENGGWAPHVLGGVGEYVCSRPQRASLLAAIYHQGKSNRTRSLWPRR